MYIVGGMDKKLYYQVISLKNEILELGGESQIYSYLLDKQENTLELSLENKVMFVFGDKNNIILLRIQIYKLVKLFL